MTPTKRDTPNDLIHDFDSQNDPDSQLGWLVITLLCAIPAVLLVGASLLPR